MTVYTDSSPAAGYQFPKAIDLERFSQIMNHKTEETQIKTKGLDLWVLQKIAVWAEEVGEAIKELNNQNYDLAWNELVQAAAVNHAILEGLEYHRSVIRE